MARVALFGLVVLTALLASPARAHAETPLERDVLAALNAARTDPAAMAEQLKRYRGWFKGKLVSVPGQKDVVETEEGVAAVDETIAFLDRQAAVPPTAEVPILAAGAADHTAEQSRTGAVGHSSADGSTPSDRVRRRGGGPYVAEVIAYGPVDGLDTVRQLIVDDGVADRGHRSVVFSPELRFAGVSCGPHPEYRTICVIDMAMTPDGTLPGRLRGRRESALASR